MAIASYLTRREGRYYLQLRLSKLTAELLGKPLYRTSLETSDYISAKSRLVQILIWLQRMNDKKNLSEMVEILNEQAEEYLHDAFPPSEERLLARTRFSAYAQQTIRKLDVTKKWMYGDHDVELFSKLRRIDLFNIEARKFASELAEHASISAAHARGRTEAKMEQVLNRLALQHGRAVHPKPSTPLASAAPPADVAQNQPTPAAGIKVSDALKLYLAAGNSAGKSRDGLAADALIVNFLIDEFDDPKVGQLGPADFTRLDRMMVDIPNRPNIPKQEASTLSNRYRYAAANGWDNLVRLTGARIEKGYHSSLSKFFGWLISEGHYIGKKPIFTHVSGENLVSLPRDSFRQEEVLEIVSMPLFVGCDGKDRIWRPGEFFVQNHLYWAYILLLLTGLRPGELGRLKIADFEERDGIWYLDLRGFDPSKGRVPLKDVVRFKTAESARIVPLHPLILDLGLLERLEALEEVGCTVVFPEWEPYPKPDGEMRWGQPLTKSWQYLKTKTSIQRKDVTVYSTRHFFADLVDDSNLTHRARKRLMGHSNKSDMPTRYGSKSRLTTRDLKSWVEAQNPTIDKMSDILLAAKERADRGELKIIKPWINRISWSTYYRSKHDSSRK
ncbi:hypothetical protein J5289_21750 [Rhizobium sp. B230/85]|uniref:hypothetical protein n=1 Tax=unclassified Rhizobium TaxID=2613769 RepID=UPI001ADA7A72|nr:MULTISPECIES: hypothetical protein [unclassified Rhizobium]MBO9135146.1 hypothetical protein [Rhizobium sp. B209b/85]QXZ97948.1 hypothetical protein J5289_21750 [Rhizobium sp. B230/85]